MNMNSILAWVKLDGRAFTLGGEKPSSQAWKERFLVCDRARKALACRPLFLFHHMRPDKVPSLRSATTAVEMKAWVFLVASSRKMRFRWRKPSCRAKLVMMGWPGPVCIFL